mgnify:CR=1 FL=1
MRVATKDVNAPQGDSMPYVGVRPLPGAVSVTPTTPAAGVVLVALRNTLLNSVPSPDSTNQLTA